MRMRIISAIMNFCSSYVNALPKIETHDAILSESYANEKWHVYDFWSPREHNLIKSLNFEKYKFWRVLNFANFAIFEKIREIKNSRKF